MGIFAMNSTDKFFISIILVIILGYFLFRGDPDIQDAIIKNLECNSTTKESKE